ncbi:MAG TPA: RHS repeat-associated core domain-containing protein [Candidatus Nanoarchaeia archaeon]|nr:hypothetical protein [Candidatus Pacearchaeota archaeon]HLC73289.1 RHS repeat-associated core domain-containing protein [Candidatus Nanoarchaeia archaeon]
MKKLGVGIFVLLISSIPVIALSLFPNKDSPLYPSIEIQQVYYLDNTIKILISSNSNQEFHGFRVNIYSNNNQDTLLINNNLQPYSTVSLIFKTKSDPNKLEIYPYYNNNHKLVFSAPIIYTITNQEQPIEEQQQITTIQQQEPQQLVNEPQYISYTSISKLDNNKEIVYFTKDHISSNRITTNQQGDIEYQANYQPYGNIYTQEGNEKFKFSGKELDSSNLYYFGARYYNPTIGRFTQVDPIYKAEESPYMYANNNPIKYTDPTGKQIEDLHSVNPDNTYAHLSYTPLNLLLIKAEEVKKFPSYSEFIVQYISERTRLDYRRAMVGDIRSKYGFYPISSTKERIVSMPMLCGTQQCAEIHMMLYLNYLKYKFDQGDVASDPIIRLASGEYLLWSIFREEVSNDWGDFLRKAFAYSNSQSLIMQYQEIKSPEDLQPGDLILKHPDKGGLGHTIVVSQINRDESNKVTSLEIFEGDTGSVNPPIGHEAHLRNIRRESLNEMLKDDHVLRRPN